MGIEDVFKTVKGLPLPEAAARFAQAGVPVFPCVPGEKRPLVEHGFHQASLNLAQITAWWRRWPRANIGVPTGKLSGVDVIDVDRKSGGDGFTGFQRLQDAGLIPGWSALVVTPSGGMHAYFPAPRFEPQRSWQAAKAHIDFRGEGGYVIVPPSAVTQPNGTAKPYLLISGSDTAPQQVNAGAIRQLLDPREPARYRPRSGASRSQDAERLSGWVAALGAGERNRGLFWAACRLAEAGTDPAATLDALAPAAERAGLPPREVEVTIRSAYRTVHSAPAPARQGPDRFGQGRPSSRLARAERTVLS